MIEAAAGEEAGKVQRMTRKKTMEGLQMRMRTAPAKSRMRKQVPAKANSATASEKPEKVQIQRMTRKKTKEGLQMRTAPASVPVKSRMRKQVPAKANSVAVSEKPEKVQRMTRKRTKEAAPAGRPAEKRRRRS